MKDSTFNTLGYATLLRKANTTNAEIHTEALSFALQQHSYSKKEVDICLPKH